MTLICIGSSVHTNGLSLLARESYPNLDMLSDRPCKWTTVLPLFVSYDKNCDFLCGIKITQLSVNKQEVTIIHFLIVICLGSLNQ